MLSMRLRARISQQELEQKIGKIVTDDDYNVLLTGSAQVYKPNGELLLVYLRQGIRPETIEWAYPILTTIRVQTRNRGNASGSKRATVNRANMARPVNSAIIGNIDPVSGGRFPYCRQTAWTGENTEQFSALYPYFQEVAEVFAANVPDRFKVQHERAMQTKPEWVIPGTPYTTITVNNTYATGVHQDAGDLKEGFSCLSTLRRGQFTGGRLVFPEFRVAVDMQDGDVLLMDAHEWHGNTQIEKHSEDAERISCVFYYRTEMIGCGTAAQELERAKREKSKGILAK